MATDTLTAPVIMGTASRPKIYKNFIDDEWVEASTGETFENRNPADTRDVIGIFQRSGKADVEAAVDAAKRAFHKWRLVPAPRRAEIVYRAAEMLMERKEDYARDMTREMGKILKETRGDVQEAIDTAYYMAGEGRRMFGPYTDRRLRHDYSMEFSHGNSIMEAAAGHRLRQHVRHKAGAGYPPFHFQSGSRARRCGRTQRRD